MVVVPIRTGVGARLGINIGYLKFTAAADLEPVLDRGPRPATRVGRRPSLATARARGSVNGAEIRSGTPGAGVASPRGRNIMIFALGFLAASLLALLIIPAVNARAERLARRRVEALFPLSIRS